MDINAALTLGEREWLSPERVTASKGESVIWMCSKGKETGDLDMG